ncbi:MAG: hypothetical protein K6T66_00370 [Peptococcaceae bacterium]|nr:hypothetical protein [Peptococcaceae bacterium]
MIRTRLMVIITVLILSMNVGISVEGIEGSDREGDHQRFRSKAELEFIVRGAVEDRSWMDTRTKEELRSVLGRYYTGEFLEELVRRCWESIARPTDWYIIARVREMVVLYDDGKRAVAEAVISIEDVDTGHNETGKGLFAMSRTPLGWRVNYASYSWNDPS